MVVGRLWLSAFVLLLGTVAISCSLAAEIKKTKVNEMEVDGDLCSLPRSPAFGLAIAAVICLSIAQVIGTSATATKLSYGGRNRNVSITLLVLSWVSFVVAAIMLATGSSMNDRQSYGKGWMDGECYVVKKGVFAGAAVLAVVTIALVLGFVCSTATSVQRRTGPDEERRREEEHK